MVRRAVIAPVRQSRYTRVYIDDTLLPNQASFFLPTMHSYHWGHEHLRANAILAHPYPQNTDGVDMAGTRVLELGCGSALPGIALLAHRNADVDFQVWFAGMRAHDCTVAR
jgi:predicted nicotinamide N-methyase